MIRAASVGGWEHQPYRPTGVNPIPSYLKHLTWWYQRLNVQRYGAALARAEARDAWSARLAEWITATRGWEPTLFHRGVTPTKPHPGIGT